MVVDVPPPASSGLAVNSVEVLTDLCQLWPRPALLCPVQVVVLTPLVCWSSCPLRTVCLSVVVAEV